MTNRDVAFSSELDLKATLAKEYMKQINNYFGDEKKALKFLILEQGALSSHCVWRSWPEEK